MQRTSSGLGIKARSASAKETGEYFRCSFSFSSLFQICVLFPRLRRSPNDLTTYATRDPINSSSGRNYSDDDEDCTGNLVCFQRSGSVNNVPGCEDGDEGVFDDVDYCISLEPIDKPEDASQQPKQPKQPKQPTQPQQAQADPNPIAVTGVVGGMSTCVEGYGCLEYIAQGKEDNSGITFGHCQGHCFVGADCSGDLKCVDRSSNGLKFESILRKFGCAGDLHDGSNYCVDSTKKLEGFDLITFEEATAPTTARPTWSPTRMPTPRPTDAPTREADVRRFARHWSDVMTPKFLDRTVVRDKTHQPIKVGQMYLAAQVAGETDPFRFTSAPTAAPTVFNLYPYNLPPEMPEPGYFDYSVLDGSKFDSGKGPENWGQLPDGSASREGTYWSQFDDYIRHDIVSNMCGSKSSRQSPIDVTNKIATEQCFEFHQIRHKNGNYPASDPKLEKQILPSKLRLHFPRDGFVDGDQSYREQDGWDQEIFGPSADMPKRWGELITLAIEIA